MKTQWESALRVCDVRRGGNPLEQNGFCSLCKAQPDEHGKLDGVLVTETGEAPMFVFFCLPCAQAIGKAAQ